MTIALIIAAVVAVLTQLGKRYIVWGAQSPRLVVIGLTAVGTIVAVRLAAASWLLTFVTAALCAVGLYEFVIKPAAARLRGGSG